MPNFFNNVVGEESIAKCRFDGERGFGCGGSFVERVLGDGRFIGECGYVSEEFIGERCFGFIGESDFVGVEFIGEYCSVNGGAGDCKGGVICD